MTNRETEEKLRKLAAIDRLSADNNWLHYLSGEGQQRQLADDLIDIELFRAASKGYRRGIFLEPPDQATCQGAYTLGEVIYPDGRPYGTFGLREDEWIKHVLITGMTGAGKTNLVFLILEELQRHNKPFLVFDWKRNYRDLKQLPQFKACRVFTVASQVAPFQFNPLLPPPGMSAGEWLMKLVDVIKHAYFVGEAIDQVFAKAGMFEGKPTKSPNFKEVREYVRRKPLQGRMSLWKAPQCGCWKACASRTGSALSSIPKKSGTIRTCKHAPLFWNSILCWTSTSCF